jgi:hypothetical protein
MPQLTHSIFLVLVCALWFVRRSSSDRRRLWQCEAKECDLIEGPLVEHQLLEFDCGGPEVRQPSWYCIMAAEAPPDVDVGEEGPHGHRRRREKGWSLAGGSASASAASSPRARPAAAPPPYSIPADAASGRSAGAASCLSEASRPSRSPRPWHSMGRTGSVTLGGSRSHRGTTARVQVGEFGGCAW